MTPRETLMRLFNTETPDLAEPLSWSLPPEDPLDDTQPAANPRHIIITGRQGAGKKSLCSSIWGWKVAADDGQSVRHFGRMKLIGLTEDAHAAKGLLFPFAGAQVILYLVDVSQTVSDADFTWVARLRALDTTVIVVANKTDQVGEALLKPLLNTLRERFGCPVIPAVATDLLHVHRVFLPAVLKACPDAAETMATEIAGLRRRVAWSLTLKAAFSSAMLSSADEADQDTASLVGMQMRLMRRIGMLYGFKPQGGRGRELALALFLASAFRLLPVVTARFPRARTWMLSGALAVGTTVVVGRMAVIYYSASLPGWLRWI